MKYSQAPVSIRKKVYERDNYTCQDCGFKGIPGNGKKFIQAHHIIETTNGGPHTLENMITVCGECHLKRDRKYWQEKHLAGMRKRWGEGSTMTSKQDFGACLADKAAVEEAAAPIGCVQPGEKENGSIRAMLEEIGQGKILFDDPEKMNVIAGKIRDIASQVSEDPLDDLRATLASLASALENAAKVKQCADDHFLEREANK